MTGEKTIGEGGMIGNQFRHMPCSLDRLFIALQRSMIMQGRQFDGGVGWAGLTLFGEASYPGMHNDGNALLIILLRYVRVHVGKAV